MVQDGNLTLKEQVEYENGTSVFTDFDGEFETATKIKGTYSSNNKDQYDETGTFDLTIEQK